MKKDIITRLDIEKIVDSFYESVKKDNLLNPFFAEIAVVNWENHLKIMYDFWENIILHTGKYDGNPMSKHLNLHQKKAFQEEHFTQWKILFNQSVDLLYAGKNAELIKTRAYNIALVMQHKILH